MSDLFISGDTAREILTIETDATICNIVVRDAADKPVYAPVIRQEVKSGKRITVIDASALECWTPMRPALYTVDINGDKIKFGYGDIRNHGRQVLVNGKPFYIRGYIRGIVAHDHPNLTGKSTREWHRKNILQAKKYGFNWVRFHSTIPDEEFVAVADELGMFIHMELGFSYEYDVNGNKSRISLDADRWRETIIKYRNHPSVAIFCLGNEMHNSGRKPDAHSLYESGRLLAPHKLIMDNSGWGEYDRDSADIYSQHIAYFFPYKKHAAMFHQDFCWKNNGSMYDMLLEQDYDDNNFQAKTRSVLNPVRPVIAHEAIHYIDLPNYAELNRKFNDFIAAVGQSYVGKHHIVKPRYLTELPNLAEIKGMTGKMLEAIAASQQFKMMAIKIYLERLRLCDKLCGYEMLQFSDCLKYENKNGIVDCFDDDKYIPADWFCNFNSDTVLLAELPEETVYEGSCLRISVWLSHFGEAAQLTGNLKIYLYDGKQRRQVYTGEKFTVNYGLSKLVESNCRISTAGRYKVEIEFHAGENIFKNSYDVWSYSRPRLQHMPELRVKDIVFGNFLRHCGKTAPINSSMIFTDVLDDAIWPALKAGKTVILDYHRDRKGNRYYWPGAFDRFKPCIWDRGNNLGGIIHAETLRLALGGDKYFNRHLYDLIEEGYKINLDHFPAKVEELVSGVDSPVRDRMKGLIEGIKDFLTDDTMRNFCYLFYVTVGQGTLIVSTFNHKHFRQPAVATYFATLINHCGELKTEKNITPTDLRDYLKKTTATGIVPEDVMTRFWELDNKPVEDSLFWEAAGVDLGKLGKRTDAKNIK